MGGHEGGLGGTGGAFAPTACMLKKALNLIGQQLLHVMKVKKRKDYREFAVIYINTIFSNKFFR